MTHLSFSDRKQAEAFYNGVKNGKIPGVNDNDSGEGGVELSWVAGPAATLPGSTTSSVNPTGDSAMEDADGDATGQNHDGEDGKDVAQGESHAQQEQQNPEQQRQQQQQQQQQESGEPKEVDYDVAGENEWDE